MIRRTVALCLLLLVVPAVAAAQQYPPEQGTAQVSDSSVTPGGTTTISGSGCAASAPVTIAFDGGQIDQGTADATGAFSEDVTIPSDASAGSHTLSASCSDADGGTLVLSSTITVEGGAAPGPAAGPTTGGGLPATGNDSTVPLTRVAMMLVVVGSAFVVLARRRRTVAAERVNA